MKKALHAFPILLQDLLNFSVITSYHGTPEEVTQLPGLVFGQVLNFHGTGKLYEAFQI